jgi:hypothetical protein
MMIAYWMSNSAKSQVIRTRLFTPAHGTPATQKGFEFAGAIRHVMPRSATGRSRTA